MNVISILERIGREINQSVLDNTKTVTRDDMISAINDCNDEMSDMNLPFNETIKTSYSWSANDAEVSIVDDVGITDWVRVKRMEIDGVKAYPVTYNELDRIRGSFDSSNDASFAVDVPLYTEYGGYLYRWPYVSAATAKIWYDKELAELTVGVDQSNYMAAANTYTLGTSIAETATHKQTYTPTEANQGGIMLYINSDGGEPITVTVHDSSNVSQGSKTLYQTGTGLVMFPIAWTWASGTYHFHVTTTAGTTKVRAGTASNLETCYFEDWYGSVPAIPDRYHSAYVWYATAAALRKLGKKGEAEIYDDGKDVVLGGRSKYRMTKNRIRSKLSNNLLGDRPKFIVDLLESTLY